jgi:hypothetical protein
MGLIDSLFKYDDQLASEWDLQIVSGNTSVSLQIPYKVVSTSLPFQNFKIERKPSGETVIKGIEEPEAFSITLRESPDFSIYKFFQGWMDRFYNRKTRTFNTFASIAEYNSYLYTVQLTFYHGAAFTTGISYFSKNTDITSIGYNCLNCKPIGLEALSLDYNGAPLQFVVNLLPEKITFF